MSEREALTAGVVGRPHGLDGSFYVVRPVPPLLHLGARVRVAGSERAVVRRAGTEERPIVRLEGCDDREAAQALRGAELLLAREAAPALGEDEWWAEDLEGCAVIAGETRVGSVRRLLSLPTCEVLEVQREGGGDDLLVPLVRDVVAAVDLDARRIEVNLKFLEGA